MIVSIKRIILAVCLALVLFALLAGISYYFLSSGTSPSPVPTATPTVTPYESPPTVSPGPEVWLEVASTEGFDHARSEWGSVVVLRPGTSGNITVRVSSTVSVPLRGTLTFSPLDEVEGVDYAFYPSAIVVPPRGEAYSTLVLEAALNATNIMIWDPDVFLDFDGSRSRLGLELGLSILVFPYTPSYIFLISVAHLIFLAPTPTPTPGITPTPYPTATPTPVPVQIPEIQVEKGGQAQILFYIMHFSEPSLTLSSSYGSGQLPKGVKAEITLDPLKPREGFYGSGSLLLTLTVDNDASEETYTITAKCNVGIRGLAQERVFNLKVTSQQGRLHAG